MAAVFCCGFECGISGPHWTPNNGSFSTTTVRSGARSGRINYTGSTSGYLQSIQIFTGKTYVLRFYVNFATLPTQNCMLCSANAFNAGVGFKQSDGKLYPAYNSGGITFGSTGFAITTGIWYRIDVKVVATGNPWTIDVQVDGTILTQLTNPAAAPSDFAFIQVGAPSMEASGNVDMYIDDVIISQTSADYPFGAGYVHHYVPDSDGAHNVAGANDFKRSLTGVDITNATTDAYTLVSKVPLPSTPSTFINMVAPPGPLDYVRVLIGPASGIPVPTIAPRTIEAIVAIHQAGTGNGTMRIGFFDDANSDSLYAGTSVAGTTSLSYKRKHYPTKISGSPWTLLALNSISASIDPGGGTIDVNPDQYWDALMLEIEFQEVAGRIPRSGTIGHPFIV